MTTADPEPIWAVTSYRAGENSQILGLLNRLDLPFEIASDAINPLGMEEPVSAEGVFFSGGFGHDYIQFAADLFAKVHPGSSVSVEPIQGVAEKLRPRFVGGNPPDVAGLPNPGLLAEYKDYMVPIEHMLVKPAKFVFVDPLGGH